MATTLIVTVTLLRFCNATTPTVIVTVASIQGGTVDVGYKIQTCRPQDTESPAKYRVARKIQSRPQDKEKLTPATFVLFCKTSIQTFLQ
jgi:hypothetical protein